MHKSRSGTIRVRPALLCLSGLDPCGGAGLSADIEACAGLGVHALPVATALTVQDSRNVAESVAVDPELIDRQLALLLADVRPQAVKIGLLGNADQIVVIASHLDRLRLPTVLDPVLRAGGGHDLADDALQRALLTELLPRIRLATPNAVEARRLSGEQDLAAAAARLLDIGCDSLLITGGDEPEADSVNRLYRRGGPPRIWHWPRLDGPFHGAGCTLAAAAAARLALGDDLEAALAAAQSYTHAALLRADRVGRGRPVPGRLS